MKSPNANANKGYIYALENENGLVKVGTSRTVEERKRVIEGTGGYRIIRLFSSKECWNPYKVEAFSHKMLTGRRKLGEWFECSFEECRAAISTAFSLLAVTEYDAPEPDYEWIHDLLEKFYIKPIIPDYRKTDEEKIVQLESFLGEEIDLNYFTSCLDALSELGEEDQANELRIRFPLLAAGQESSDEVTRFAMEAYSDLNRSKLCNLWGR